MDSGSHGGEGTRHHTQRLTEPLGLLPRFPLLVKLVAAALKKLPYKADRWGGGGAPRRILRGAAIPHLPCITIAFVQLLCVGIKMKQIFSGSCAVLGSLNS